MYEMIARRNGEKEEKGGVGNIEVIESLRFRLVAYSRCASHGRNAPRCALRFRRLEDIGFLTL